MTVLSSRRSRGWVAVGLKGPSGMVKGRGQEWAGAAPALVQGTPEPGAPVTGASAGPWHQKCVLTLTQHDGGPRGSSSHQAAERSLPCCPTPPSETTAVSAAPAFITAAASHGPVLPLRQPPHSLQTLEPGSVPGSGRTLSAISCGTVERAVPLQSLSPPGHTLHM